MSFFANKKMLQENGVRLIQLQAPIALKRTAKLLDIEINIDRTIDDVFKRKKYANTLRNTV